MKISIITVTYNSSRTLTRAIRSVCRQDYKDIEHIIVDGESADSTLNIIKEYAGQYPQIKYVSEPDNGIYDAINKGIQMATGDIIGLLNSDDELQNNHIISHIVKHIKEEKADILYGDLVYCKYDLIAHNPPRIVRYWKSNPYDEKELKFGWMPPHPSMYCKKEVFEQVGLYRTDFRISADYEFILRAFSKPELKKTYLEEVIVRMETGGISNHNMRTLCIKTKEDFRAMKIHNMKALLSLCYKKIRKVNQFIHPKTC